MTGAMWSIFDIWEFAFISLEMSSPGSSGVLIDNLSFFRKKNKMAYNNI